MKQQLMAFITIAGASLAVLSVAAMPAAAQSAKGKSPSYNAPRTADGKPDLSGIWEVRNEANYDLEPHAGSLGIPPGTGVIVDPADGKVPYKPEALAKRKANFENRKAADPVNHCYMPGVPRLAYTQLPFQIFQTPGRVQILYEYAHVYRNIYLNGTPHIDGLDFWNGDSRGHWEGNTLVVDVTDFNDKTWLDASGDYHSGALHVIERYTRTGPNTIQYEATIEDPNVYTKPWKISMPLYRHTESNFRLLEYECEAYADNAPKEVTEASK